MTQTSELTFQELKAIFFPSVETPKLSIPFTVRLYLTDVPPSAGILLRSHGPVFPTVILNVE